MMADRLFTFFVGFIPFFLGFFFARNSQDIIFYRQIDCLFRNSRKFSSNNIASFSLMNITARLPVKEFSVLVRNNLLSCLLRFLCSLLICLLMPFLVISNIVIDQIVKKKLLEVAKGSSKKPNILISKNNIKSR